MNGSLFREEKRSHRLLENNSQIMDNTLE
jgi:hypothetical protein